jgi:hypothetical protein
MVAKLAAAVQRLQLVAPVDWLKRMAADQILYILRGALSAGVRWPIFALAPPLRRIRNASESPKIPFIGIRYPDRDEWSGADTGKVCTECAYR